MTPTRLVILAVSAALLLSIGLIGLLALRTTPIPDVLQNIAVGSLTGLVGLLVPRPAAAPEEQPPAEVGDEN